MKPKNTLRMTIVFLLTINMAFAGSSGDSWKTLVGKKFAKRAGFGFVENNAKLPNVLIYGDSISIAYTPRVQQKLKGKANVYRLYCNGGDSGSVINKMTKMQSVMSNSKLDQPWTFQWDVIHFNIGLHDLKYLAAGKLDKKNGKQVSSIEDYKKNLNAVVAYFKKQSPKAKLIFATTTPVPEGESGRVAGDAKKYNTAALAALRDYPDIQTNDLFGFTKPNHAKWWTKPGNVHYNATGSNSQGDEVARIILMSLH